MSSVSPPATSPTEASARLAGVDVIRLIAAFGVVLIHCGDKAGAGADLGEAFRRFCVPFFYATGAFFLVREILQGTGFPRLGRRLRRLLVPYALWSAIYVGARWAKWTAFGRPAGEPPFTDQLGGIVLLGGAAVHLYFIPVLAVGLALGTVLAPILRWLESKLFLAPWVIAAAFVAQGLIAEESLPHSFGPTALAASRLALSTITFIPWLVTALLILAAVDALGGIEGLQERRWIAPVAAVIFVVLDLPFLAGGPIPAGVHSWLLAECLLVAALAWPPKLASHPMLARWLPFSFGVYLVHHLVIEALRLSARLAHVRWPEPFGLGSLAVVSFAGIAGSLAAVFLLRRSSVARRWLLGE